MVEVKFSNQRLEQSEEQQIEALIKLGADPLRARFITGMARKELKGDILAVEPYDIPPRDVPIGVKSRN